MLNFSVNKLENEYENLGENVPVYIRFFWIIAKRRCLHYKHLFI